jgi:hypothetical protein
MQFTDHHLSSLTFALSLYQAQKWASNCDWKHSQGAVGDYGESE